MLIFIIPCELTLSDLDMFHIIPRVISTLFRSSSSNWEFSNACINKQRMGEPTARVGSRGQMTRLSSALNHRSMGSHGASGEGLCSFLCENAASTHRRLKGMGKRVNCIASGKSCVVRELLEDLLSGSRAGPNEEARPKRLFDQNIG